MSVAWLIGSVWSCGCAAGTLYAVLVLEEVICMTVCQLMLLLVKLGEFTLP